MATSRARVGGASGAHATSVMEPSSACAQFKDETQSGQGKAVSLALLPLGLSLSLSPLSPLSFFGHNTSTIGAHLDARSDARTPPPAGKLSRREKSPVEVLRRCQRHDCACSCPTLPPAGKLSRRNVASVMVARLHVRVQMSLHIRADAKLSKKVAADIFRRANASALVKDNDARELCLGECLSVTLSRRVCTRRVRFR